jgi:Domain of unknown function DUF29
MSLSSAVDLYEDDFYTWTQLQAKELRRFARSRPNLPLDLPRIAEEIADLWEEPARLHAQLDSPHCRAPAPAPVFPCPGAATRLGRRGRQPAQRDRGSPHAQIASRFKATSASSIRPGAQRSAEEARALRRGRHCGSLSRDLPYTFDQILDEDWWPVRADESAVRDQP